MITSFSRFKRFAWLGYLLAGVLAGLMIVVLGLSVLGFPEFLTRWILADVNRGDFFIQTHDVYLDLGGGFNARNVRVYRKGLLGPPFLEARECRILYRLFDRSRSGRSRIKELKAFDGTLRPLWSFTSMGSNWPAAGAIKIFPPSREGAFIKEVDLDVALFNFEVLGVWVERVKASVQVEQKGVFFSRLTGKIGREMHSGTVDGTLAWHQNGQVAGRLATTFDPRALIPVCQLFYPEAVGVLDQFSFPAIPPRMDFTFEAKSKPVLSGTATGRIQASNYAYRGAIIGYASMTGKWGFGEGTNWMRIDPFTLTMEGRQARGQVDFDFISGEADFQVRSEVNIAAVLRILGLKEYLMAPWDFEAGARVVAKGRMGYSHPENSKVEAMVEGSRIGYKGIYFNDYSFDYKNSGFTHTISNFRGNTGGGFVSGSAVLLADRHGDHWTADVKTEIINADTDELLKLINTNPVWRVGGKAFGTLEVSGMGAELKGQGQLTIREARIFKSPLASGLLAGWGRISRDLDLADLPAEARFSFVLSHNQINSRDFFMEAGSLGLEAQGGCGMDGSLNWHFHPLLMKKSNAKWRTMTSFFMPMLKGDVELTGTFDKPEWHFLSSKQKD